MAVLKQSCPWVGSTHGLGGVGLAGLGWVEIFGFFGGWGWVMGRKDFQKILKLGRPLVNAEVIPHSLKMINTDK